MRNFNGDDGFAAPSDIDDGFNPAESDAARYEKASKAAQFNFSLPADKKVKESEVSKTKTEEAKDVGFVEAESAAKVFESDTPTVHVDETGTSYKHPEQGPSYRPAGYYKGDSALAEAEAAEDRADDKYFASIEKAMQKGNDAIERGKDMQRANEAGKDTP